MDTTDWLSLLPKDEDMEKWENGEKWVMIKDGTRISWRQESQVGTYRFTDRGYESRDPDGRWVNYAQMPKDTSHLTEEQRERLLKELKGEIKVSMQDGDLDDFRPLPEIPPLEKWPFQEVAITPESFAGIDEQLQEYRQLEMTRELGRAFYLAGRWKLANEARRHLGYNVNDSIQDVGNLNGSVLALRAMVDQIKRTARYRKLSPEEKAAMSDSARLDALRVSVILGTTKGSAMALWAHNEVRRRIAVDICIGDDCMDQGGYAEEVLLRSVMRKGAELGATKVWCRTRRTESGRVYAPKYFARMGFTRVPYEQQDDEDWQKLGVVAERKEVVEAVPSLNLWLSTRGLDRYLEAANAWCKSMGAADVLEVADNKADLAAFLESEHKLTAEERERLMMY